MQRRRPVAAILAVTFVGALAIAGCGGSGSTYALVSEGNHAYTQGDSSKALNDYRQAQVQRPDLPVLNYNAGNALYQQGDYTRGVTESQQAAQNGDDPLRAHAFYSIGADDYRQGKLQDALDAYKNALRIDPSDTDAKYNVELIQRQLDREAAARQGLPTPTPPAGQQGQQGQNGGQQPTPTPGAGQQQGNGQQGQASQPGQQGQGGQPGQGGQSGQSSSDPNGQQGQAASGQQTPGNGATQPGQPNSSQAGQGSGGSANAAGPGTTGTPQPSLRAQQQQAQQALQSAVSAYQNGDSIDDALKILDALAQQQALQQQAQANQSDPHSRDK